MSFWSKFRRSSYAHYGMLNEISDKGLKPISFKVIGVIILFLICAVLLVLVGLKISGFKRSQIVKSIEITGASLKVKSMMLKDLQPLYGQNMSSLALLKLKSQLIKLSWFRNLSIWRVYPSTLKINVVEKEPLLIWEDDDNRFYIVNSEDKIIRKASVEDYNNLIFIEKGDIALKNSDTIRFVIYNTPELLSQVDRLTFMDYSWNIVLKGGLIIKLPDHNIDLAIKKIMKADQQYQLLSRDIQYIDARVANKLFIMPADNS